MKYVCDVCGWEYDETVGDPDNGIAPGTKFEDLPEDFVCPLCGVGKDMFSEAQNDEDTPADNGLQGLFCFLEYVIIYKKFLTKD